MQANASSVAGVATHEEGAERGDRFGGDGEEKPCAVDAGAHAWFRVAEDHRDERGVDEHRPQRNTEPPQSPGQRPPVTGQPRGAAEDVGGGDDGEEPEAPRVAGEIGDKAPSVETEADEHQHREHDVRGRGDQVEAVGEPVDALLLGADRHDARGHHECEVAGEQGRDRTGGAGVRRR